MTYMTKAKSSTVHAYCQEQQETRCLFVHWREAKIAPLVVIFKKGDFL